ncbi:hypothetical protein ACFCT7_16375 [Fulvivirgaceae bacterium LMO-SS25]
MKKTFFILALVFATGIFSSCARKAPCPAYTDATEMPGDRSVRHV